jgi:hypothetical protein
VKFYPRIYLLAYAFFISLCHWAIASGLYGLVKIIASILKGIQSQIFCTDFNRCFFIVFLLLILPTNHTRTIADFGNQCLAQMAAAAFCFFFFKKHKLQRTAGICS